MGSDNVLDNSIPEVDLSELKPASPEWESARSQVWKAVEEHGCFRAVFRKIPLELPVSILSELKEIFHLPLETKKLNDELSDFASYGGYVGKSSATPLYESIGFDDPLIRFDMVVKLINVLLPPGRPDLCKRIYDYTKQISELESIVVRMIMESLGVVKYLDEHLNSVSHSLRFQNYDLPETTEGEIGLIAHKDQDMITILYQNQVDGLEVEIRDGEWVLCKPSPDNFIIVIGESLHAWTNGRVCAPNHRVTLKEKTPRCTIGLFTAFKKGFRVKAPEELVDEEHPLLYKPFDHYEYLELVKRDAIKNPGAPNPLSAYYRIGV